MSNTASTPRKPQATFVDHRSIRNFATASAALTVLLNVIMLVYGQIEPTAMPNAVLAGLALFLCVAYSLSFLKRDPASGISEYVWLTALNSAILFSSLTGINNMLKNASEPKTDQNIAQIIPSKNMDPKKEGYVLRQKTIEASFGVADLKNIIIPKQAWFNPAPVTTKEAQIIKDQAKVLTTQALQTVTQTETAINKVVVTQSVSNQKTDSLSTALQDLRSQCIKTYSQVSSYQATITDLNEKLKACTGSKATPSNVTNLQKAIETSKLQWAELQSQQQSEQVRETQRQQQQKQQLQLIQKQQQQVHLMKFNIQQQQEKIH